MAGFDQPLTKSEFKIFWRGYLKDLSGANFSRKKLRSKQQAKNGAESEEEEDIDAFLCSDENASNKEKAERVQGAGYKPSSFASTSQGF